MYQQTPMVFIEVHCWVCGSEALHTPLMLRGTHRVVILCVPVVCLQAYRSKAFCLPLTCLQSCGATALHTWLAVRSSHGAMPHHEFHHQHPLFPVDCWLCGAMTLHTSQSDGPVQRPQLSLWVPHVPSPSICSEIRVKGSPHEVDTSPSWLRLWLMSWGCSFLHACHLASFLWLALPLMLCT